MMRLVISPRRAAMFWLVFATLVPMTATAFVAPRVPPGEQTLEVPLRYINDVTSASDPPGVLLPGAAGAAWNGFLSDFQGEWYLRADLRTGRPSMIWGEGIPWVPGRGNAFAGAGPVDLGRLEGIARDFMLSHADLFGVAPEALTLSPASGALRDGSVWFVTFAWTPNGIPALNAYVFFRVNNGNLIQLGSRGIIDAGLLPAPTALVSAESALQAALKRVAAVYPENREVLDGGSLVYVPQADDPRAYAGPPGQGLRYRLCRRVSFVQDGTPATWVAYVDARDGSIVALFDDNRYACDPAMLHLGKVTGGVYQVQPADPEIVRPFPFTGVIEDGTPKTTDYNAIFTYDGGTASSDLSGPYFDMNCTGCSNPLQAFSSNSLSGLIELGSGGGETVGNGFSTSPERNTYYHLSLVRALASKWLNIGWFTTTVPGTVNIPGNCNAYWDGWGVNFLMYGGGCNNTGEVAGVVYHEYGHGLDQNTGSGEGARGEGIGDGIAVHIDHVSSVGPGFFVGGGGVRDIDENISGILTVSNMGGRCPGGGGPLGYEVHCEGELLGQVIWRLSRNLVTKYGDIGGWYVSERLFFGSFPPADTYLPDQPGSMYDAYIAVDDDDGNLANGTPNANEINDAYGAHEIASTPRARGSAPCSSPGAPNVLGVARIDSASGTSQVLLSWAAVPNAAFYNVYRNEKSRIGAFTPIATNLATTSFTDTNVTNGLTYYYQVMTVGNSGCVSVRDNAIQVPLSLPELVVDAYSIDDTAGGNGNGAVEPGEQVTMRVTLRNTGAGNTTGVTAKLSTADAWVSVTDDTASYGNIAGLGTAGSTAPHYTFRVDPDLGHCEDVIRLVLTIESTEGCWLSTMGVAVGNGVTDIIFDRLVVNDLTPGGNGNGVLDPGEQVYLRPNLSNVGAAGARNVIATLSTSDPAVTVTGGTAAFGTIAAGSSAAATPPGFAVTVAGSCGDVIQFDLVITSDDGCWKERFPVQLGMNGPVSTIAFYDFESGAAGWTHGATAGTDEWTLGYMGTGVGQEAGQAFSGVNCWGTDLGQATDGNYEPDTSQWLDSPSLDCSTYSTVFLDFERWLSVEEATYDQARVLVNGTEIWGNAVGAHPIDTSWAHQRFDISSIAAGNSNVVIRFQLDSDPGLEFGGWNVDDVRVFGLVCEAPAPRPELVFDSSSVRDGSGGGIGNGNGFMDPGEMPDLVVDLKNIRNGTAVSVSAVLSLAQAVPGITILNATGRWADIPGQAVSPPVPPAFSIRVDPSAVCGEVLPFVLDVTYGDGASTWTAQARFNERVGAVGAATGAQRAIFFDDMEAWPSAWRHGYYAEQDDWQLGVPAGQGQTDPSSAHSGSSVWGTDLGQTYGAITWNGNYRANVYSFIDTPAIDCTDYRQLKLRYWRWLSVEEGQYDQARILVNGTLVWENPPAGNVEDTAWTEHEIDISAIADGNPAVTVRYELQTDAGLQLAGWNIDDFGLFGVPRDKICVPYNCSQPPPLTVGNTFWLDEQGNSVAAVLNGYTGSARLFSLYRTTDELVVGSMGPGDRVFSAVPISAVADPSMPIPVSYYYDLRAVNDCGQEELP